MEQLLVNLLKLINAPVFREAVRAAGTALAQALIGWIEDILRRRREGGLAAA